MKDNVIGFLNSAKGAGALLLTSMVMAFVWVNSPFAASYELIHHAQVSVSIGDFELGKPMISWINEGLMVIFFFLVGLEIKREVFSALTILDVTSFNMSRLQYHPLRNKNDQI